MAAYSTEGVLYQWNDERDMAALDKYKVWLLDRKETTHCATPFALWIIQHNYDNHGIQYASEYFATPGSKGVDWRIKDGWLYITNIPTTPEEDKVREAKMRERIAPWIEDFGREYHKGIDELVELHNQIKSIDIENIEDWELKDAFGFLLRVLRREANLHFLWMIPFCVIYGQFEDMCKDLLGIDRNERLFNDLMAGYDHKILQSDRETFRLGAKARELGLEPTFKEIKDDEKLLSELERTEAGRQWLQALQEFLKEYGWRTIGVWDASDPIWLEKPSLALPGIRRFMAVPTFARDEVLQKLIERRNEAEKEVLSRIPENKKEEFIKLMEASRWAGIVDEEHTFYTEFCAASLSRYVTKEIGKRLAKAGAIDDIQDLYYLLPDEIDCRIISKYSAKKLVAARKKEHAEFRRSEPEPFIGDPEKIAEMIWASPLARSTIAPIPRVRPELNADLYGTVSAPGIIEGIVNVITSEEDFDKFEPGSILVAIETAPTWTPLFNSAKAIITDVGGILSHAAIIGREYGLPVVSGCIEGTKKLKTGMRVRVDGDAGTVYILDK